MNDKDRADNLNRVSNGKLMLVAILGFVVGNFVPSVRIWLPGLSNEQSGREIAAKEPRQPQGQPVLRDPKKLAASWTALREKADEDFRVAERILKVMIAKSLPETDLDAQKQKMDALRAQVSHYDKRLHELAEVDARQDKAISHRKEAIPLDELEVQHRQVVEQLRLERIIAGQP